MHVSNYNNHHINIVETNKSNRFESWFLSSSSNNKITEKFIKVNIISSLQFSQRANDHHHHHYYDHHLSYIFDPDKWFSLPIFSRHSFFKHNHLSCLIFFIINTVNVCVYEKFLIWSNQKNIKYLSMFCIEFHFIYWFLDISSKNDIFIFKQKKFSVQIISFDQSVIHSHFSSFQSVSLESYNPLIIQSKLIIKFINLFQLIFILCSIKAAYLFYLITKIIEQQQQQ